MKQEIWQRTKKLFNLAREMKDPSERAAFLEACGETNGIKTEVRKLLDYHEEAGDFFETPMLRSCRKNAPSDTPS